nr:hypothetical protein [Tanacetum cinerariifolium]
TSESSPYSTFERSLDSSSLSAGPFHKRCKSPTTSVPSSTPVLRLIGPTLDDLLPPRKRFRDSYSPKDSREERVEIGTADAEAVADLGIGDGVGVDIEDGIGMGFEIAASDIRENEEEFEAEASMGDTMEIVLDPLVTGGISESTRGDSPNLKGTLYDIVHYMSEEEFRQICRDRDYARRRVRRLESLVERRLDMTITRFGMTLGAIEELIAHRVADALANYKATRAANTLEAESQSQNANDDDNGNGGNGNGNHGGGGNNENGDPNENGKGAMPVARMYTYQDFVKCQPLNFKGTEGVVGLTSWFEKMETMFHISNCLKVYQVKMVPCEEDRIERYVGGLPNNIQGNVMSP